jgi:hypothetical protein
MRFPLTFIATGALSGFVLATALYTEVFEGFLAGATTTDIAMQQTTSVTAINVTSTASAVDTSEHILEKRKCFSCREMCALSGEICVKKGYFDDGGKVEVCWKRSATELEQDLR